MKQTIYILIILILTSCGQPKSRKVKTAFSDTTFNIVDTTLNKFKTSSILLNETANQEDLPVNDYLSEKLKPIRTNFKRINSIKNWTSIKSIEILENLENGEAKFYYFNQNLEKIVTRHYGETFQLLKEYYLLNGQLSIVLEKRIIYNRPLFYDTTAMKENNDNEVFDQNKSEIVEDRSYFENNNLLHQINNQDCGSPFAADYLFKEQNRILKNFNKIIKLIPNP